MLKRILMLTHSLTDAVSSGLWGTGRENAGRMDLARAVCAEADVLLTSRAETLSVVQWGRLTDAYLEQHSCSTHPS